MSFWRKRDPSTVAAPPTADAAALLQDLDRRYRRPLTHYFEKRIRQSYDIDDLVQEVFIRLTYRSTPDNIEFLDGYIFKIAANVIRDRLRRQATHCAAEHDPIENSPELADDFSPERVLMGRQLLGRAVQALRELPARTRQVFVLAQYEEMTQEEIAARLGLSISGVRFHLRRAKAHVARRLEQDV